jgi:hypothetical protein
MKRHVLVTFIFLSLLGGSISEASSWPSGATGKCNDGTYSYAKNHKGMCSRHHGVAIFK